MRSIIPSVLALGFSFRVCGGADRGAGDPPPAAAPETSAYALPAQARAPASEPLIYRVPIDGLPTLGDPDAPVTVVAFTDYECPFCRRVEPRVRALRARYGGALRVVVAERPLPMHARARAAALAALAAAEQGKLEGMRARLFSGALDEAAIEQAAADEELASARFVADRTGAAADALVRSEALADRLGVRGTPTFFINGRRVVGAQPLDTFVSVVDERLAAARARMAAGTPPRDVYAETIAGGLERVAEDPDEDGACKGGGSCKDGEEAPLVGERVEAVPTDGAPARGPHGASVTVVEFSDYECPFCRKVEPTLRALEAAHPGQVRVVYRNLPLPIHSQSRLAAKAALAADDQGRFWEMHDALFAHQGAVDPATVDALAAGLGLDMARFERDLAGPATEARVAADETDAAALQVTGTPTLFVNGLRVTGAQPLAAFESAAAKAR
jgi:protein-disulfide isomerase